MGTLLARAQLRLTAATMERRITWIFGSARSGTTWLAALLARAIDATIIDEPLIGAHLATPVAAITSIPDPNDALLYRSSAPRPAYFFSDASAPAWEPALRALVLQRFAAAARDSRRPRGPVVVKEPNGSLAAPLLARSLPRSRLLFLVRDGRDVIDSMVDGASGGWIAEAHGASIGEASRVAFIERRAHQWVQTVSAVSEAFAAHPADLRLRLTYEALLADPVDELERVLTWLGHPVPRHELAAAVEERSFENLPDHSKGAGRFARAATPGLWRAHLSDDEKAVLAGIMGPTLREHGYEPE